MRVTNNYMTRNYLNNLNNSLSLYNESENKLTTGRKISKMSDDVSAGTRALGVDVYKRQHSVFLRYHQCNYILLSRMADRTIQKDFVTRHSSVLFR